jgi:hypothetical protein
MYGARKSKLTSLLTKIIWEEHAAFPTTLKLRTEEPSKTTRRGRVV